MPRAGPLVKHALQFLCIAAALSGCGIDPGAPLVSGEATLYQGRQEVGHVALSPSQLDALSQWLDGHRRGWHAMITEATNEPGLLSLSLKHTDHKTTFVNVVTRQDGSHYALLFGSDKWSYSSFAGLVKSWAATRSMTDQDVAALQHLVQAGDQHSR
jgi:hypothetical protein